MYHLELHKFPGNMARFNLSEEEMLAVVRPWARGEWIEFGERKWNPHEARLTVLEGPQIPVNQLRVGRGWRLAQRQAKDVTASVLAAVAGSPAGQATAAPAPERALATGPHAPAVAPPAPGETAAPPLGEPPHPLGEPAPQDGTSSASDRSPAETRLLVDSLGLQILALLDRGSEPLRAAWELAETRLPGRPASESLALAEQAVRGLLGSRLIVLFTVAAGPGDGATDGDARQAMGEAELEIALSSPAGWTGSAEPSAVRMRRP